MLNLLFLSLWVFNASGSMSQFRQCTDNHTWANPRCNKTPAASDCLQFAQACKTQCQAIINYHDSNERTRRATPVGQSKPASILVPSELTAAKNNLNRCTGWVTANGGDTVDDDAAEPIVDDGTGPRAAGNSVAQCREYKAKMDSDAKIAEIVKTPEQLASCVAVCREATEGRPTTDREVVELTQIGTKCYENIPDDGGPSEDDTSVASDDGTDQSEDSSEVTSSDPTPQTNDQGLSALSNLFQSPPSVGTDLSGNLDVVNWATGPSPDMSLFDTAAANASAAANTGMNFKTPGAFNGAIGKASVRHIEPKAAAADSGGGAGGVPSPFMGGGGMPGGASGAPAGRAAASGNRGGYGPVAGSQLQKVGQNTFYSGGGGSMIPSGGPKVAANNDKKRKPAFNPRYAPKSNDGSTALARMFGKSVRPEALSHRPNNGYAHYGQSCLNTVFCGIENRFQDLLQDFDTGEPVMADTSESKTVRGTASDKKP